MTNSDKVESTGRSALSIWGPLILGAAVGIAYQMYVFSLYRKGRMTKDQWQTYITNPGQFAKDVIDGKLGEGVKYKDITFADCEVKDYDGTGELLKVEIVK